MLVIAHRGASGHAPENTLAAFRRAVEMGARAVEFDVHQTLDGELVVAHDDDLKRCGGGDKRRLGALRWAEVEKADVGSWFDKRFAGEKVPRLADVFDAVPPEVELHLELKHGSTIYRGIEERVVEFLRRRDALRRTVVSSFDHESLRAVRSLERGVRLAYLLGATALKSAFREMQETAAESLDVSARRAAARLVEAAHERGYKVMVYTVNTPAEREALLEMGVDGIFTNYPELDLWR